MKISKISDLDALKLIFNNYKNKPDWKRLDIILYIFLNTYTHVIICIKMNELN